MITARHGAHLAQFVHGSARSAAQILSGHDVRQDHRQFRQRVLDSEFLAETFEATEEPCLVRQEYTGSGPRQIAGLDPEVDLMPERRGE